jgi:hypothetical protein
MGRGLVRWLPPQSVKEYLKRRLQGRVEVPTTALFKHAAQYGFSPRMQSPDVTNANNCVSSPSDGAAKVIRFVEANTIQTRYAGRL